MLEGVVLVLPLVKVVEHLGVGEGGGGEVAAHHRPGHHTREFRLGQPHVQIPPGQSVVNLQPDEATQVPERGLDDDGPVTVQLGVPHMTGPSRENSI